MTTGFNQLSYRVAAVQEASPEGLVVILYDVLAEDVQRAINDMRDGSIERRSSDLKHAMLVLQLLEGSLDMERGGSAARSLAAFYTYVRRELLNAQFLNDESVLERLMVLILDVRGAWSAADAQAAQSNASQAIDDATGQNDLAGTRTAQWSA